MQRPLNAGRLANGSGRATEGPPQSVPWTAARPQRPHCRAAAGGGSGDRHKRLVDEPIGLTAGPCRGWRKVLVRRPENCNFVTAKVIFTVGGGDFGPYLSGSKLGSGPIDATSRRLPAFGALTLLVGCVVLATGIGTQTLALGVTGFVTTVFGAYLAALRFRFHAVSGGRRVDPAQGTPGPRQVGRPQ
jgi:hypothetical protein